MSVSQLATPYCRGEEFINKQHSAEPTAISAFKYAFSMFKLVKNDNGPLGKLDYL